VGLGAARLDAAPDNQSASWTRPCGHGTSASRRADHEPGTKLDGVNLHMLRHSVASLLIVRLKLDVETVARQLGMRPQQPFVARPF